MAVDQTASGHGESRIPDGWEAAILVPDCGAGGRGVNAGESDA